MHIALVLPQRVQVLQDGIAVIALDSVLACMQRLNVSCDAGSMYGLVAIIARDIHRVLTT